MPATTITRPTIVNGVSILNTQMLSSFIFDKIDQLFAGGRNYTQFEFGGVMTAIGNVTQTYPDGGALGDSTKAWGSLFLKSLSTINYASSVTITHAVDTWTLAGGTFYDFQGGRVKGASTISVGGATPSTSGAGVSFPAAQSDSTDPNTFDDYEEGTFTPTVAGTWVTTPTSVSGYYTKLGRCVHLTVQWVGGTKSLVYNGFFQNLPFNPATRPTIGCVGVVVDTNAVAQGNMAVNNTEIYVSGNSFTTTTIGSVFYYV